MKVFTFGSAAYDIFVKPKKYHIVSDNDKFINGKGVAFDLGSKIPLEFIHFASGGGGTNTAATFAKQGFDVFFVGKLGNDLAGREILKELKSLKIGIDFVTFSKLKPTNHTINLANIKKERTSLAYYGASEDLREVDIPFGKLKKIIKKGDWFYIAPIHGSFAIFEKIVSFGLENGVNIAVTPGMSQIEKGDSFKKILSKINILVLNKEEASLLTKTSFEKENEMVFKLKNMVKIVALTKGEQGCLVISGDDILRLPAKKNKVIDVTGAGDAFGAGFVSGIIFYKNNVKKASDFGIKNATACIGAWGAKAGLLKINEKQNELKKIF